jgi:hypothetical protein
VNAIDPNSRVRYETLLTRFIISCIEIDEQLMHRIRIP